jgi:hypothetical protein
MVLICRSTCYRTLRLSCPETSREDTKTTVGLGTNVGGAPLKSKVFISCGQANKQEIRIASKIGGLLRSRGFHSYIAKKVLTVFEINSGIIRELKDSHRYLFVNFRRERIGPGEFRGSLFSNQEFAIAYALGLRESLLSIRRALRPRECLPISDATQMVFHIESKRIGQRRKLFAAQDDRGRIIVERAAARKLLHLGQHRLC